MKKQVFNPYLPNYEYIPDGEPHIFGDRLYVYGSHDKFGSEGFCRNDYVCWSAPCGDLSDWRYEGVIYKKTQDAHYSEGHYLYAPDVTKGPDGRYYLYYILDTMGIMSVAVCDTPAGKYEYYGDVCRPDGSIIGTKDGDQFQFDPGILVDDDERVFLYTGFGPSVESAKRRFPGKIVPGCACLELEKDMITLKEDHGCLIPQRAFAEGTEYEEHPFFEASSIRKIGGVYYLIYSSSLSHELCYATSLRPDGGFRFGGTIVSNGDIGYAGRTEPLNYTGNNHGGIVNVRGTWYVFYHRQTNYHHFSRQGCAEKIEILPDGSIPQVEITSCGLNGGPLAGKGHYNAAIACNLMGADGACSSVKVENDHAFHPRFTQTGVDGEETETQYINNMTRGAKAGFKYFDLRETTEIAVEVKGAAGAFVVTDGIEGKTLAKIEFPQSDEYAVYKGSIDRAALCEKCAGKTALFFTAETDGAVDFMSFTLT